MSNLRKIHTVGTKLFHSDRQTDMSNSRVCNFAKAPKKSSGIRIQISSKKTFLQYVYIAVTVATVHTGKIMEPILLNVWAFPVTSAIRNR
jgi:hypothetical protein